MDNPILNSPYDADTLYGQLLRRMVPEENVRYSVVVPGELAPTVLRVPSFVRRALSIDVYTVAVDGSVDVD